MRSKPVSAPTKIGASIWVSTTVPFVYHSPVNIALERAFGWTRLTVFWSLAQPAARQSSSTMLAHFQPSLIRNSLKSRPRSGVGLTHTDGARAGRHDLVAARWGTRLGALGVAPLEQTFWAIGK